MSEQPRPIGGGADDEVARATANEDLGTLPVASQTDPLAFAEAALTYSKRWLMRSGRQRGGVTAFVNDTRLMIPGEERVLMFRRSYSEAIAGCIHRCDPSLNRVRRTGGHGGSIGSLTAAIVSQGLGDAPAVLVDLEEGEVTVLPEGVEAEEAARHFLIEDAQTVVNGATVREFLDRFHHVCTRAPAPGVQLWANPAGGVPVARVEEVLSGYMVLSARIRFDDVYVHPETVTDDGRADVYIAPAMPAKGEPCVVELKVLRSRGHAADPSRARPYSDLENETFIVDGVDQAHSYCGSMNADVAILCCYDMRDDDDRDAILECARDAAARLAVVLLRYYVARSHKEMRRSRPGSAYETLRTSRKN